MKRLLSIIATLTALLCYQAAAVAQEYVPTPVTISKEKVKLNGKVYLSHVVLERQTIYGICKAYGVTEEQLYEANPSLKATGLQKNAILLVPYQEAAVKEAEKAAPDEDHGYTEHTVRWYEDLDDIARQYRVSVKDIMDLNGLKTRKVTTRQVLRIPLRPSAVQTEEAPSEQAENVEEPAEAPADTTVVMPAETPDTTSILRIVPREQVSFSLVLPLKDNEYNMDFYSGVLMAVKDVEQSGVRVKLNVFDLAAGLPNMDVLAQGDFVLGPVASLDVEAILQRLEGRVPLVSPLDQKAAVLAQTYKSFIQVPTPADCQYEDLAQWVKEDLAETDRVLFVCEKGAGNVTAPVALRSAMAQREIPYEILSYAIVEGRGLPAILTEMMTPDGTNRVVVASESEAFVGDVVRNLGIMLGKGFDIVMYAPSKARTFDTIEGSDYHDARLHISTVYYADYSSPEVDRFVRAYRALFQTEPSQFAFQGYDTARYFMDRSARYGADWVRCLDQERAAGLHTDFLFTYDGEGNAANQAVRRIFYRKDYSTTLER